MYLLPCLCVADLNKFCFIGKNLDKEKMIKELRACIHDGKTPDPGPIPNVNLTYKVGDRVLCRCENWELGVIAKLWVLILFSFKF